MNDFMAHVAGLALFALLPVAFAVRLVLALFVKSYRDMIRQHPVRHILWFVAVLVYAYTSFVIPTLIMRDARARAADIEHERQVQAQEQRQNKAKEGIAE